MKTLFATKKILKEFEKEKESLKYSGCSSEFKRHHLCEYFMKDD